MRLPMWTRLEVGSCIVVPVDAPVKGLIFKLYIFWQVLSLQASILPQHHSNSPRASSERYVPAISTQWSMCTTWAAVIYGNHFQSDGREHVSLRLSVHAEHLLVFVDKVNNPVLSFKASLAPLEYAAQ